jgi:hypothetical protein
MMSYDEQQIAEALAALPPAPDLWVQAAQELPRLRQVLDEILARIENDADFRTRTMSDLEAALLAEGYEPDPLLVQALRHRLEPL